MKEKKTGRCLFHAAAAIFLAVGLSGCGKKVPESYNAQYLDYFDTITSITIYADSQEQFETYKKEVEQDLKRYHELFQIYEDYEGVVNVKTINDNAGIAPVQVDPELFAMLEFAVEKEALTRGRMNIAMGSVLSIWHDYREEGLEDREHAKLPEPEVLQAANAHTDIQKLRMNRENMQVYLEDPEMKLDVGSVAKGYATHQIAEKLREMGVTSALLNLGGNVETIGRKADGAPWKVGVQNPDLSSPQSYIHVVELENRCLVTSGIYQRFYEVDGVRYHHIIHPDTLFPWNAYQAVSILTDDSGMGDVLSTAIFNMDLEEGKNLIESLENTEAMWILEDGTEEYSSGFRKFMTK